MIEILKYFYNYSLISTLVILLLLIAMSFLLGFALGLTKITKSIKKIFLCLFKKPSLTFDDPKFKSSFFKYKSSIKKAQNLWKSAGAILFIKLIIFIIITTSIINIGNASGIEINNQLIQPPTSGVTQIVEQKIKISNLVQEQAFKIQDLIRPESINIKKQTSLKNQIINLLFALPIFVVQKQKADILISPSGEIIITESEGLTLDDYLLIKYELVFLHQ